MSQLSGRYVRLTDSAPFGVFYSDSAGRLTYVNRRWCELAGMPAARALGEGWRAALHPDDRHLPDEAWRAALGSGSSRIDVELRFVRADGSLVWVLSEAAPEFDESGEIIGFLGSLTDISERKRMERARDEMQLQVQQAQRMDAMGKLAGGIAHDFNNLLHAIDGFAHLAETEVPPDSRAASNLSEVREAARRAGCLTAQMLAFGRRAHRCQELIQLEVLIDEVVTLMRSTLPATVLVGKRIVSDVGPVLADLGQLHQVLVNLCSNAGDAIGGESGAIELRLDTARVSEDLGVRGRLLTVGEYARITVSDDGPGMEKPVLERIFEPFFSTQEGSSSVGMGLSVADGIVQGHGGAILARSERGAGTRFEVYLPLATVSEAPTAEAAQSLRGRGESILFVDDEPAVALMGERLLASLGYQVLAISDSAKALELFRADPERFDLLITDQTMPNLTGADLANRALKIQPGLRVILCTGVDDSLRRADVPGVSYFVAKPMLPEELSVLIRRALDASKDQRGTDEQDPRR